MAKVSRGPRAVGAWAVCLSIAAAIATTPADARPTRHGARGIPLRGSVETNLGQTYAPGTIVISVSQRRLYLITGEDSALLYPIAVGKAGKAWTGPAYISGKYVRPAWAPPPVVKHDNPKIPDLIPGGAPGNPMGERALTLNLDEIAIHGTSRSMRKSIGTAASYGCIRMLNEDVIDLFDRVRVGTPVVGIR
jgi:lipoprotein-anchoring transpeptidase ErfK/SrfK